MSNQSSRTWLVVTLISLLGGAPMGCPVWRTEHKVETTHKIEAHIVLDIRMIEESAEDIESEVREGEQTPAVEPDGPEESTRHEAEPVRLQASRSFWSIFDVATVASAKTPDDLKSVAARRSARFKKVDEALTQGKIGEDNKGNLKLRPFKGSGEEKQSVKKLIDEENADRKIIYASLARKQGLEPKHAGAVGEVYSTTIRRKLKPGQWFQLPGKDDLYTSFLKTKLGKMIKKPKKGGCFQVPKGYKPPKKE